MSRIVTIIAGVQVMEVTTYDQDGDPVETSYRVKGDRYDTLEQAIKAARGDDEGSSKD